MTAGILIKEIIGHGPTEEEIATMNEDAAIPDHVWIIHHDPATGAVWLNGRLTDCPKPRYAL